jgi:hypothetical protein
VNLEPCTCELSKIFRHLSVPPRVHQHIVYHIGRRFCRVPFQAAIHILHSRQCNSCILKRSPWPLPPLISSRQHFKKTYHESQGQSRAKSGVWDRYYSVPKGLGYGIAVFFLLGKQAMCFVKIFLSWTHGFFS